MVITVMNRYSRDSCNKKVSACSEAECGGHYCSCEVHHPQDRYIHTVAMQLHLEQKTTLTVESEGRESLSCTS